MPESNIMRHRGILILAVVIACSFIAVQTFGQGSSATLSGIVLDPSGAVIPAANVTVINMATRQTRQTTTSDEGYFTVPLLAIGSYTVRVQKEGFATIEVPDVVLNVNDHRDLRIELKVGKVSNAVTVEARSEGIETGGGMATVVSRGFVENTALNGRSFQPLILMTPGAVLNNSDGYISFNGMRSDMNYFTVDGISANVGVNSPASTFLATGANPKSLAGVLPALNTFGGTQGMLGLDDMEEFKVQTSAISAQYGRQMGGQVQLTSRSGSNAFHGSAYDYLRNDALDARAPNLSLLTAKPRERQNDFGVTFGGPIQKDKTFFFFSYEGQRVITPNTQSFFPVPSIQMRNGDPSILNEWLANNYPTAAKAGSTIPADVKAILNMYPLPNAPCPPLPGILLTYSPYPSDPTQCMNKFSYTGSNGVKYTNVLMRSGFSYWLGQLNLTRAMDNWSLKLDRKLSSNLNAFLRYSQPASSGINQGSFATQTVTENGSKIVTLGLNWLPTSSLSNSLSVNFTKARGSYANQPRFYGGGIAPGPNDILDPLMANFNQVTLIVGWANITASGGRDALNRQLNLVDNAVWAHGKHSLTAGIDVRYLFPRYQGWAVGTGNLGAINPTTLYLGTFLAITMQRTGAATVISENYSLYVQDTWRVTRRLTIDPGLRWEINPAPHATDPNALRFVTGWSNPAAMTLAPAGTPYYDTPWRAFAPRLGAAYQIRNQAGWETTLRGGWGVFYDLAGVSAMNASAYYPNRRSISPVPAGSPQPLSTLGSYAVMAIPSPSLTPPYPASQTFLTRMDNLAGLPKSYQWNFTVEQALGRAQVLSVSYVGNVGRNMLRSYGTTETSYAKYPLQNFVSPNFPGATIQFNRNDSGFGDSSEYNGLQVQFHRRMNKGVEVLANWTWSHAFDTNSQSNTAVTKWDTPNNTWGASDNDRRHILNMALTYETPKLEMGFLPKSAAKLSRNVVNGWSLNTNFKAQSGNPVNVVIYRDLYALGPDPNMSYGVFQPDLVPGQPIWISAPGIYGGKYLNPNAFAIPASCITMNPLDCHDGTLPRNSIVGFGLWQVDASVRRFFPITERVKLEFRADFFNLLNHPNWGAYNTYQLAYINQSVLTTAPSVSYGMSGGSTNVSGTLANSIGGGLLSMYQQGGPRSIQLALKLTF